MSDTNSMEDIAGQPINVGDYVACAGSKASQSLYIGEVKSIGKSKITIVEGNGRSHTKFPRFLMNISEQVKACPEIFL